MAPTVPGVSTCTAESRSRGRLRWEHAVMPDYGQPPMTTEREQPPGEGRRARWAWRASLCFQGLVVLCLIVLVWGSTDHWRLVAAVSVLSIGGQLFFELIRRWPA